MSETFLQKYARLTGHAEQEIHDLACKVSYLRENVVRELDNMPAQGREDCEKAAHYYYATVAATLMALDGRDEAKPTFRDLI